MPFLASQRGLVFEQQGEPLGVFEGARVRIVIEFLEALGHAMQAERVQLIESGMGEHSSCPSVEVARTANIGMIEQRRLVAALARGGTIQIVGKDGGDAPVVHCADLERPSGDRLGTRRLDAAIEPQDAEAGSKALLGMRAMREDSNDQRFGVRANGSRPAPEAVRRPFGVTAMRARHVVGIGAMPAATVATLMGGDTPAAMEHLDGARGDADVDLGANERVRHRVEEVFDLDMIVEPDAGEATIPHIRNLAPAKPAADPRRSAQGRDQ
jgi:hypothetical protein